MPNRRYEKGRRQEYAIATELRKRKFVVIRASGSHSPFDLVAISKSTIYFIQSKATKMTIKEKAKLYFSLTKGFGNAYKFATPAVLDDQWREQIKNW